MKTGLVLVAILLFVSALIMGGCSHRRYGHHWGGKYSEKKAEHIVKKLSRKLDLDEEQKANLEKIKDEILAKADELKLKGSMSAIHDEFTSQLRQDTIDQEKINSMLAGKEANMKEMREFLVAKFAEFHSTLTAEQKEKLAEWNEKRCRWKKK